MGIDAVIEGHLSSPRGKAAVAKLAGFVAGLRYQQTLDEFGPRCPDFEPECVCCKAWAEFDEWMKEGTA